MLSILIPYIDSFFAVFNERLGLAEIISERTGDETKRFPAVRVGNGQLKQIDLDHIVSYHRLRGNKGVEYTDNNTRGCTKSVRITYPMHMIGMLKNDCQYSDDTICNNIANGLNGITIPKSIKSQIMAWLAEVQVVEINQDSASVFEQEYTNVDLNIDYGYAYFSISYNLIIEADSACLSTTCGCDGNSLIAETGECLESEINEDLIQE